MDCLKTLKVGYGGEWRLGTTGMGFSYVGGRQFVLSDVDGDLLNYKDLLDDYNKEVLVQPPSTRLQLYWMNNFIKLDIKSDQDILYMWTNISKYQDGFTYLYIEFVDDTATPIKLPMETTSTKSPIEIQQNSRRAITPKKLVAKTLWDQHTPSVDGNNKKKSVKRHLYDDLPEEELDDIPDFPSASQGGAKKGNKITVGGNEAIGGSSSREGSTLVDVEQRDFIDLEDHVLDPRPMDAYRKAYDGFVRPIINQKDWNKVSNLIWKIIGIDTPHLANHRGKSQHMVTLTLALGFHLHNQHHQVEDMVEGKEGMLEEKEEMCQYKKEVEGMVEDKKMCMADKEGVCQFKKEVEGMVEDKKVCMLDKEEVCQCKEHKREHISQDGGVGLSQTPPLQLQPTTKKTLKIFKENYFG